ncbi:hypothetical protein PGQ11_009792 [Apiospora arundinis]|uniref:Putative gamma-glutamylcyclotransferase n=1 Tax=Apiospora arundinis TaxID=335852 RepID=A0ABR2I7L2_9PEZI
MAELKDVEEQAALEFLQGIPPAPPLPSLSGIPPPPPLPPGLTEPKSNNSVMAAKFAAAAKVGTALTEPSFRPRHFFFYGSLMDPEVFQAVTKSAEAPIMRKGWIRGFRMKMWGIYPTLVPETEAEAAARAKIRGTWCMVDSHIRFVDLQEYETHKYMLYDCTIFIENGTELKDSGTFGWSGEPDSGELEDGVFDFERYQKYFKPSVLRPRPSG